MSFDMERPRGGTGAAESTAGGRDTYSVTPDRDQPPYADQLTLEDARRARDEGQRIATHATDVAWTVAADRAIADLAASGEPFSAVEVKARCGAPIGSPNAMGARFSAAARAGIIRRIGYRQSTETSRQGGVVAVWCGTGGGA